MNLAARLVLILLFCASASAHALGWVSGSSGNSLAFKASFEGADAPGVFHRFEVHLTTVDGDPSGGSLVVDVDMASADLFARDLNEAVAEPEWFDFSQHPAARFVSHEIVRDGAESFQARGVLNLKGAEQAVVVPFEWRRQDREAVISGRLSLQRGDYDIGSGDWADDGAIGQAVEVEFNVRMQPDE